VADLGDFHFGAARWGAVVASWCHLPPWVRTEVHGVSASQHQRHCQPPVESLRVTAPARDDARRTSDSCTL
jgi:hypothetical protein